MKVDKCILRCSQCKKKFKYNSDRERHELSHFQSFKCTTCSKTFNFLSALRRHQKQHERGVGVECNECGKTFPDETLLGRHKKYAHEAKLHICVKCAVECKSKIALKMHMKIHKPESERKYKCDYQGCGKSFNFIQHWKHHTLTHTNSKQYYCDICKKGFIQFHHYKDHLRKHQPENWLPCTQAGCSKKFTTEYSLKRHMDTHGNYNYKHVSETSSNEICSDVTKETTTPKEIREMKKDELENPKDSSLKCSTDPTLSLNDDNRWTINDDINHCKSVIGTCIAEDFEDKECLCTQMSQKPIEHYDQTPKPIIVPKINNSNIHVIKSTPIPATGCEGCECSFNTIKITNEFCVNSIKHFDQIQLPKIEYDKAGTIKLRDTFDIGLEIINNVAYNSDYKVQDRSKNETIIPYNSCKAILGNCIVSGSGVMGEGCLCAKMAIDEQHASAEEIADITPQPEHIFI